MFSLLASRLSDGNRKAEIRDLLDNNVLILDLRDPSEGLLIDVILNDLEDYLTSRFETDTCRDFQPGFVELLRLAESQQRFNRRSNP